MPLGLSSVIVKSRGAVEEGKSIRLHCEFSLDELKGERLYSVLWYWAPEETQNMGDLRLWPHTGLRKTKMPSKPVQFFRYRTIDPSGDRKKAWDYKLRGIFTINVAGSTSTSVLFDRVSLAAAGTFSCEVSTTPEFVTHSGSTLLAVARLPNQKLPPQMHFEDGRRIKRYKEGDMLHLNCTSSGGYPSPNISWFINGEKASLFGVDAINFPPSNSIMVMPATPGRISSEPHRLTSSLVSITIQPNLLTSGNLKVKCVVTMYNLYHRSNEVSVETIGLEPKHKSIRHLSPLADQGQTSGSSEETENLKPNTDWYMKYSSATSTFQDGLGLMVLLQALYYVLLRTS